ncbi:tetratricopeptide repeat protein [Arthrospira platensis CENA650]
MSGGGCVGKLVMRSGQGMSAGELLRQANQLKRSGRLDEAIALYHQVIDINPHFAWAYHGLGDALVKQGKLDEAVVQYRRAIEIHPNSACFRISLGQFFIQQSCWDEAINCFGQAIQIRYDLNCKNGGYHSSFKTSATDSKLLLDDIQLIENSYTQWQLSDWENIAKLTAEMLQNYPNKEKIAVFVAIGCLQQGDIQTAQDLVRQALDWGLNIQYISQILTSVIQNSFDYTNTLSKARSSWYIGDWAALVQLDKADLVCHSERAKLALLAAAGYQQLGEMSDARRCTDLALEWGCSHNLVFQILVSGIYNLLGRGAAAARQCQLSFKYFSAAFSFMNGGEDDLKKILLKSRVKKQIEALSCLDTKKAINSILQSRL